MYIDITLRLTERTRVYPGDPPFRMRSVLDPARGDSARVHSLSLGTHTGTHVDAPSHLGGKTGGIDSLSLEALIGPALVVEAPRRGPIGPAHIARLPARCPPRILFKGASPLLPEAAALLVRRGALLVGTDGFSIDEENDAALPTHRVLLSAGVVLVERLVLAKVRPGRYDLFVLPLLIPGADGAPARAVLRDLPTGRRAVSVKSRRGRAPRRRSGTRRRA